MGPLEKQEQSDSINEDTHNAESYIHDALNFLIEFEFVRLQMNEETSEQNYMATRLGMACLGMFLFIA